MTRWLLAALHLLALAIGFAAIWGRRRALLRPLDPAGLRAVFYADNWWGIAFLLWLSTGLARLFGPFEKGATYYLQNHVFLGKMACLVLILLLELWPMVTLIRWRIATAKGAAVDTRPAAAFARISTVQAGLVVIMVLAAAAMARGLGMPHE